MLSIHSLYHQQGANVAFCSVVDFAFRAAEGENGHLRTAKFWVNFLQSVYAMGFIGIAGDLSNITRVYLLTTTRGSDPAAPSGSLDLPPPATEPGQDQHIVTESVDATPKPFDSEIALTGGVQGQMGTFEALPDEPQRAAWINRFGLIMLIMRITALALGGVYGGVYFDGIQDHSKAVLSQQMRYACYVLGALPSTQELLD